MDSLPHPSHGGATAYGPDVQGADASSSNHAFREAVERSPDGFTLLTAVRDASGRIADFRRQYVNPAAAVLLGRPREVLVDGLLLETTPWDAVQRDLFSRYVSIVEGGGELDLEVHVPLRDGGSRWIRLTAVKVGDGVAATFTDVTARTAAIREWRAAERALRASDERFRLATDAIHAIVYDIDYTTERAVRSRGLREVLGFDPDEVPDTNAWWFERMHVDDLARVRDEMRTATAGTAAELRFEYRLRHRDGHWVHVEDQSIAIYAGDRLVRQVGCCQDVTDLRDAVAAVRDRAEELAALMEASPGVTFIAHDPEARVITGNRAAREALRMSGKDNLSKTGPAAADAAHFSVWSQGRKLRPEELPLQVAAAGQEVRDFDDEIRFDNGETVFLFGSAVPLRDEHGRSRGAVGAFVDVTSLKRAEQALREADRRKDEFLAMLAHELRNPLAPIRTRVEVLEAPRAARTHGRGDARHHRAAGRAARRGWWTTCSTSRGSPGARSSSAGSRSRLTTVVGRAVETSRPLIDARRHHLAVSMPDGAGARGRRPGPARAGRVEPPQQRGEVHRRGRTPATRRRPRRRRGRDRRRGQRSRDRRRHAAARVRPVRAGGPIARPLAGRPRDRADAGADASSRCTAGAWKPPARGWDAAVSSACSCRGS